MAVSGLRPYTGTFLIFSDYMRPPTRLAALMKAPSVFVFSHIQSGDQTGAAAVAVVMLVISFAVLLAIGGLRFLTTRHERA